ncbi:Carbon monoxide dehydrogenase large chain [Clostridioides difficile]|nr:Carbon monoxide dehydrogenase large chain [Clostridioides difficile]
MARVDARDKTLGLGEYTDDIRIEGMVYGAALRSKYPRALVKSMDITEAENLKGVIKIVTAEDIPGQRYLGHYKVSWRCSSFSCSRNRRDSKRSTKIYKS